MYVCRCLGGRGLCSVYVMCTKRWSEVSSCDVFHVDIAAMSGVAKDMSGDVCAVFML